MGLLAPARRVYHGWRQVLPLYDGRECPDCGVPVLGREARRVHREGHMAEREWQEWVTATILQVARFAGMTVPDHAADQRRNGDGYDRVDLIADPYGDDDDD